ncbi:MAG TPA: ABC transporter substrate-binding protein [Candidatus Hydrogenedens sp.]|nr:ABC transporter substrate-binding protein [Candidatus Hydrogenedens sp.]HOK10537.1 ABC transporter substrate-binding protein [Candidatus Hydrogenedens sp.]HOL20089.1 ABC transporter substrate-binding protein [Candidatus Hydrogenedens sp.]HPP60039.1 ABC transporter substrate-binding protein [Candidatus Hydrogenedens sp.]
MLRNLFAIFIITATLISCGPSQQASDSQKVSTSNKKEIEIAVIPKSFSHQFWLTVKAGAEQAGKELGVKIIWQGTAKETEVEQQINIVQDMINRNVNAIVLAASDANALVGIVETAVKKGIPVVTIDSGVNSEKPVSFVATDNVAGAKIAAEHLAKLIGEEGDVGLIPFVPGAATSEMRERGFKEGIANYPKIKLVSTLYSESNVAKAMDVTNDMLTSFPSIKGIFAANESSAVGCAQAIKSKGKAGQVKIVAFDAAEEEIQSLKDGVIQALIVQNPFNMGYLGVKTAYDTIQGKPVEKRIDTGVTVVTLDNINNPEIQKLLNPI